MSDDFEVLMELDDSLVVVVENCLKCGRGDDSNGKLLVCSVIGCPISVHEECMCCRPEIDDEDGKFYCPYCAYKRAVVRSRKLRNKAMIAKEFLSMYIDSGDGGVEFAASDGDGENVDKGSSKKKQCVCERREEFEKMNEDDGLDQQGDEDSVMMSEGEMQPAGEAVVPESGGVFYLGSPVLRKRHFRQRGRRRLQTPFAAIPLRMVPSPSDQTDDAVEEDAKKKHSEKDTVSSDKHEKGAASSKSRDIPEPNENDTGGTSSSDSRDIPDVHRTEKTTASSFELRDIPNLNHSTTSFSESRDIPDLNECKKATTFPNESRDIPDLNKIEKADTTFSSKSRDMLRLINIEKDTTSSLKSRVIPEWNQNENDTTSFSKSRNVPDSNQNKMTTATTGPRKVADLKHNENTTASEPRKAPDSKQNEKTTASASEPSKIRVSESEDVLFHNANANAKRRRINWSDQELQTLKDGVKMFSGQVNKNLPWRKILEYGKDVFHETRNPDNLKDKWKNLTKEASLSNKKQT